MLKNQKRLKKLITDGRLIKPQKCKCGNNPVNAHHKDYFKPLKVIWLCSDCHMKLHLKERKCRKIA